MADHDWVPYELKVKRATVAGFEGHIEQVPDPVFTGLTTQTVICVDCGEVREVEEADG